MILLIYVLEQLSSRSFIFFSFPSFFLGEERGESSIYFLVSPRCHPIFTGEQQIYLIIKSQIAFCLRLPLVLVAHSKIIDLIFMNGIRKHTNE